MLNVTLESYCRTELYAFNKETINFTKPIYVGFTVLELSKLFLFEW